MKRTAIAITCGFALTAVLAQTVMVRQWTLEAQQNQQRIDARRLERQQEERALEQKRLEARRLEEQQQQLEQQVRRLEQEQQRALEQKRLEARRLEEQWLNDPYAYRYIEPYNVLPYVDRNPYRVPSYPTVPRP